MHLPKHIFLVLLFVIPWNLVSAQTSCADAEPFCSNGGVTYPASTNAGAAPAGPNYGCLFTRPNPAWFYLNIANSGAITITLTNSSNADIDFIIWGPFADQASMCTQVFAGAPIVDCSYSAASTEYVDIPNAQAGQWYMLMITNYSNQNTNITANQTSGSGVTNCDILCAIDSFTAIPGPCDPADDTFDLSGTITSGVPPTTGTLTLVETCTGASQTFNAPFGTTINYSFPNLISDGAPCSIQASFSVDPSCTATANFTAPVSCFIPDCIITGHTANVSGCDPNTVTFDFDGQITFDYPPAAGTMTITTCSGEQQTFNAPFVSPINYSFTGLYPDNAPCTIDVAFSDDAACVYSFTIQEPFPCDCPAEIGTFQASANGVNDIHPKVCFGDNFALTSTGGYIPPVDVSDPTIAYEPAIGYFVFSCQPTFVFDPTSDPCYAGYWTSGMSAQGTNDGNFFNQFAGVNFNNGEFWVVPITMYNETLSEISVTNWAGDCYAQGSWVKFTLLTDIQVTLEEDCPNGAVLVSATGGGPSNGTNPYSIDTFTPSSAAIGNVSFNLGAQGSIVGMEDGDNYSVAVTDVYGCVGTATGGPFVGPIIPVLDQVNAFCSEDPSYQLTATPAAGVWSGQGVSSSGMFNPTSVLPGDYTISFLPNGCSVSGSMQVTVVYQPDATISFVAPLCIYDDAIQLTSVDGGGSWTGPGVSYTGLFNPNTAGVGQHTITHSIPGYCPSEDDIVITVNGRPNADFSVNKNIGCAPLSVIFSYEGDANGTSCEYFDGNGTLLASGCGSVSGVINTIGCADITYHIIDEHGCENSSTQNELICTQINPAASFSPVIGEATVLEPTISFLNFSDHANYYHWTFDNQGESYIEEPTFEFSILNGNDFYVCLEATNDIGCIDTDCQIVTLPEVFFFYVPNAFTPNGDGVNDVFKTSVQGVSGDEVYEYTFTLFNKWGDIVFVSYDPSDVWLGDTNGDGYYVPDGVYFWQARIRYVTTTPAELHEGHLIILR